MNIASDMQAILDHAARFGAPAVETVSPANARNLPTLENATSRFRSSSTSTAADG